jgi:predicted RNase H-like HicB family nuclease
MSMMTVDDYLGLPYSRVTARSLTTNGNMCYVALRPELPGCRGQGKTPDKARENLDEATRLYIQDLLECGEPVPVPRMPRPVRREAPQLPRYGAVATTGAEPSVQFEDVSAELVPV